MPSRHTTAETAVRSLLDQVDTLFLYLDGFDTIPEFAHHAKISPVLSADCPDLHAGGKFHRYGEATRKDRFIVTDDDIQYPPDFVKKLRFWSQMLGGKAAVGIHGSIFNDTIASYTKDRRVLRSERANWRPSRVDVLATNGLMLRGGFASFDPTKWTHINQVDLNFAFDAKALGMRKYVVPKRLGWITLLEEHQKDSIFRKLRKDNRVQTERVRALLGRTD